VTQVVRRGGHAVHVVAAAFTPGEEVEVVVDWARRWDHMQQHSGRSGAGRRACGRRRAAGSAARAPPFKLCGTAGQHLLSAVAAQRHGWKTLSWYAPWPRARSRLDVPERETVRLLGSPAVHRSLGDETCLVELDTPKVRARRRAVGPCSETAIDPDLPRGRTMLCRAQISDADRDALEAAVNDHIRQNLPYRQHLYRRDEYARRRPQRRRGPPTVLTLRAQGWAR